MKINGQGNLAVNGFDTLSNAASHGLQRANGNVQVRLDIADLLEQWLNKKLQDGSGTPCHVNGKEAAFMKKLGRIMGERHADPDFGLQEMACEMYMSACQLQRALKTITGHHPAEGVLNTETMWLIDDLAHGFIFKLWTKTLITHTTFSYA